MSDIAIPHEAPADGDADRDDRRLLGAFIAHEDRAALERLLTRHATVMFRVALRACGNAADAEDAVQEACLDAMRAARSFRGTGSVRGWLLAAVSNRCRMAAREAERRRRREESVPPAPATPPPEDLIAAAQAALAHLSAPERQVIELRCIDGLANSEIALVTGRRQATVRKQAERGLARLRALLGGAGYATGAGAIAAALLAQAPPVVPSARLSGVLAKAAATGPVAAGIAGAGVLVASLASGLALAALGGTGWWTLRPRELSTAAPVMAVAPFADPVPQVAPARDPLATLVTIRLHRGDIAEVMDVLEQQAGFTAVIPPAPTRAVHREGGIQFWSGSLRPQDAALVVEGVPLARALDGLAASGWSWRRIAGRICLWRSLDPALRADAARRLGSTDGSPDERAIAAYELIANRDPEGVRVLLAAMVAGGEPGKAARTAFAGDPPALLLLADDAAAQRTVSDALARTPTEPFWITAAGQVRAVAEVPRLRQILARSMEPGAAAAQPSAPTPAAGRAPDGGQVAAAARGLGWMGERSARSVIEAVARDHPSIAARIAARMALGDLGDPDSLPMLLELLAASGRSPSDRSTFDLPPVLTSLVRCAPPSEQAAVVRAVFAEGEKTQNLGGMSFASGSASFQGAASLRGITDPAAWQECTAVLGDAQRTVGARSLACSALGAGSDRPEIREALLAVVADRNSIVAEAAARALAVHADAALAERLGERLAAAPAGSGEVFMLARGLGYTRTASAAEALLRFAPRDKVWARVVLEAALDTGQPDVPARIRAMLEPHWPAHVRGAAALHAMGEDPRATARLIESLLADETPEVRASATRRLQDPSPDLDRIAALRRRLGDASETVRLAAAETIHAADLAAAMAQAILPLARDPNARVRAEVASLLPLTLDDDAVWKAAEELGLRDPDRYVRMRCLDSLGLALDRKHPRIVQAIELLSRMRADPEEITRRNAQQRLEQIGAHHPLAARLAKEAVAPPEATPAEAADPKPAADF